MMGEGGEEQEGGHDDDDECGEEKQNEQFRVFLRFS